MNKNKSDINISNDRKINSVSKKILKELRKDKRLNPDISDVLRSMRFKESIMARTYDNSPEVKKLREKFVREDTVERRSSELYDKYVSAAITERDKHNLWAQAVQAVKMDSIPPFTMKWAEKVKQNKNSLKQNE